MENCPKHLHPLPSDILTENQKHQQGSDILSNQNTSSQPLVQPGLSIMVRKKQSNAIIFIKQESVANISPSS